MKIVTTLFGCVFVLMMFGGVMLSIHNFRGRTFTEPHTIATGAGITSANITLAADVMDGDNTNISITSNVFEGTLLRHSVDAATVLGLELIVAPALDALLYSMTVLMESRWSG